MTSRWAVEVAPRRSVPIRWRAYGLTVKNADITVPEPSATLEATSRQALRVVEAVWADHGDEPIGRLYTEIGTRFHHGHDVTTAALAAALDACGLGAGYIDAADDDRWDVEIRGSMAEAIELVGSEVGVPILVFSEGDAKAAVFGPLVSPAPSGEEALALWDGVVALAWSPSFFELKRTRTGPPRLSG